MVQRFWLPWLILNLWAAAASWAQTITGRVVGVADGDTVTLLTADKTQIKVRLEGIDAPEKGQEFGTKAREALSKRIQGKDVRLSVTGQDRYGRTLGVLHLGDEDVNLWLVRNGWAWQFLRYNQTGELAAAQRAAQAEGLGLWKGFRPIPPWEFRELKRAEPG